MPFLKIETNISLPSAQKDSFMQDASQLTSKILGKPESYVMVSIQSDRHMQFAATTDPCAYIELKSIGLLERKTSELSAAVCALVSDKLSIKSERVYIEFSNSERHLWGWDGGTF